MAASLAEQIAALPADETQHVMEILRPAAREAFVHHWPFWARAAQLAPPGDWRVWLILAGRGFGKTRAGAEWVRAVAEADNKSRIALIGANLHEARGVMVEGESGLLAIAPEASRPMYEPSLRRLRWPGGAEARLFSAAEPESLRGSQHSHAWCDEIAKWDVARADAAWDNLAMGLRLGDAPRVVATTTPRHVPLVHRLVDAGGTRVTRGRMHDNRGNLPPAYIAAMREGYGASLLGRQELDGELIAESEGALWSRALIERCRMAAEREANEEEPRHSRAGGNPSSGVTDGGDGGRWTPDQVRGDGRSSGQDKIGRFTRVVIGVDPPASANGDACGIIVAALDANSHGGLRGLVLADHSVEKPSPERWARAVAVAAEMWRADRVVAEANQGGAMVKSVLHAAEISLPVKLVHASRGKAARAEPVAALYEAGRVFHAGLFPQLEDEMCGLMPGGDYRGPGRSPDRADALVWALTELMLGRRGEPHVRGIN